MQNDIALNSTVSQVEELVDLVYAPEVVFRKHPASLGKLNRITAKATATIVENGHNGKRFKRDYKNGVASYVCKSCGAGAIAVASEDRGKSTVEGTALSMKCSVVNS